MLVALHEAEDAVGRFRTDLDRSAGWGVPAHVTVLYPFVTPDRIDHLVLSRLAEAVASETAFDVILARTSWFGNSVLWLAPEPDEPFRALTKAVWSRFPDCPPYSGEYADLAPHLTIGHDAPIDMLRAAADAIQPRLPLRARVAAAQLMQGSPEPHSWHTVCELPLGRG